MSDIYALGKHGQGVMRDVDRLVKLIREEKDKMLIKKIHRVSLNFAQFHFTLSYRVFVSLSFVLKSHRSVVTCVIFFFQNG